MRLVQVGRRSRGLFAQLDDFDYDLVSQYSWHSEIGSSGIIYACRSWFEESGRQHHQRMHTLITGWSYVDHEDHNGLNCQRYNMREADDSRNMANSRKRRSGTSIFKGVSRYLNRWQAAIMLDGHTRPLGHFDVEEDAARRYDQEAVLLFGEFACTNEMLGLYEV